MNTDFRDIMSNRTDEELIKIVTVDRDGYQQLGIEAAEEEIRRRKIDQTKIEVVKAELLDKLEEEKNLKESSPDTLIRFGHFIIDTFAICLLIMILSYFIGYFGIRAGLTLSLWHIYLMPAVVYIGYYVIMETKYQKTIGKFITKTSVRMKDGGKPKIDDIVRRTFCRLIPFDQLSFLFITNGFHDQLSDTIVIKD